MASPSMLVDSDSEEHGFDEADSTANEAQQKYCRWKASSGRPVRVGGHVLEPLGTRAQTTSGCSTTKCPGRFERPGHWQPLGHVTGLIGSDGVVPSLAA